MEQNSADTDNVELVGKKAITPLSKKGNSTIGMILEEHRKDLVIKARKKKKSA